MNLRSYQQLNQKYDAEQARKIARKVAMPNEPPMFEEKHWIEKENDNVFLNVIINHDPLTPFTNPNAPNNIIMVNGTSQVASFSVTKNTIILDKCSDYYASIVRFSIPLDTIPIMIMQVIPNQSNPKLTPYYVGFSYLGVDYFSQLIYLPQNNITPPVQNQPTQVITDYYGVFNYQVLIDMINVGFVNAFNASPLFGSGFAPPYMFFDPVTNLISLVYQPYFLTISSPLTGIPIIYINGLLEIYLDSFYLKFITDNSLTGHDYEFILQPNPSNIYYTPNFGLSPGTNSITAYRQIQEYSTLEYWSSVAKILITTSTIPINPESVPAAQSTQQSQGLNVAFPIISDFSLNIDQSAGTSRTIAYYLPTAQYKLVDMISDIPLQKIDLKFYWQDKLSNLYPIELAANQQIEVKLGFFRKSLYKKGTNLN